jgi:hypothetical protein
MPLGEWTSKTGAEWNAMNPKLLILLAWVFYLLERRTSDVIWLFCMVFSCALAVCAYFYKREDRGDQTAKKTKES